MDYSFIIIIGLALFLGWLGAFITRKAISQLMKKRERDGDSADLTKLRFLKNSASMLFFGLAMTYIFLEIPALNKMGQALFAGAGILAAVIGFASQKAFSNIISGIFVLLFKPYRIKDTIEVGARMGIVEDITLRHTVIRDYSNKRIIIPNSLISDDTIVNSDTQDKFIRQQIFFGVSYESNLDVAYSIIREEAEKHPYFLDRRSPEEMDYGVEPVTIRLLAMEDSGVKIRAQVWASDINEAFVLKCDLLETVKKRFAAEGIEIPYPHRTLLSKEGDTIKVSGNA